MKKTVTINISGIIYHIDEDAYNALQEYLKSIRQHFRRSKGCEEIMADIEARISEIFSEKASDNHVVITIEDVEKLIELMGKPDAFVDETQDEYEERDRESGSRRSRQKRIYRDPDHSVIGGVCSGLGYYFGIDPVWLRIAFVLFFFGAGSGILVYIVLWVAMPEAKTSAEKLEMRGEPVNIGNIGKNIENEMDNIRSKLSDVDAKKHIGNVGSFLESVLSFVLRIITIFFKAFGKLIGVVFIIAGTVALTVFMYSIFSGSQMITSIRPDGLQYFSWQDISGLLFSNADQGWLAIAGIALLVGIPLISIVYSGLKILFNFRNDIKIAGIFLTSLFLSGLIMCLIAGLQLSRDFSYAESTTSTLNLDSCTSDTLFLELTQGTCGKAGRNGETGGQLNFNGEALYIDGPRMDIISSNTDSFEVSITRSAKGSTKKDAYNRARNISYRTSGNDCHIGFGPCYSIEKDDKWRVQQLDIEVRVPEGKTVFIAKGMEQIIYDIQNATNTRDKDMPGHFWTVKSGVLTCADCPK